MPPYLDSKDTPDLGAVHNVRRQIFRFVADPSHAGKFLNAYPLSIDGPIPSPFCRRFLWTTPT